MDEMNSGMVRDAGEPESPAAGAFIKEWQDRILQAKSHWKPAFDRMRRDMKFATGIQWPGQTEQDDRYVANIVGRIIKTTVSAAYAKNPTVVQKRRKKLDFKIWDEKPESAMQAMQMVQQAQAFMGGNVIDMTTGQPIPPPDPMMLQQSIALVQDIVQGTQKRDMVRKVGLTLEALAEYFIGEGKPSFKSQMKRVVRRVRTTGVGYIQLAFQRAMDLSEEQSRQISDFAEQLAKIGQLQADLADGEMDPYSAQAEELRAMMEKIQGEPEVIVREGVTFSFPRSTRLIPSPNTEALMHWVGTDWLAEEILMAPDRVKQVYGIDLGKSFTSYRSTGESMAIGEARRIADRNRKDALACVWRVFDKDSGLEFTIAEGYPRYLKEPAAPDILLEQFYPYFAITFNEAENDEEVFPRSDVNQLVHIQREYNRAKEALRQHRIAARPLYLAPASAFETDEEMSLATHQAHEVIKIQGLAQGQKASDVLMPVQKIGVDPNLYETGQLFDDMQRVSGNQEATIGGTGNATATESNIAESSRQGTLGLDTDNIDEVLTELFGAMSQVMLEELDEETVKEIVGPGAVWPQLSRSEIAKELWLEVKAGSSGRPDQAREAATFERLAPTLLQIPGIRPQWFAERAVRLLDDDTDITEVIIEGLPAIMAQNRMSQVQPGDPAAQPDQQGAEGADKTRAAKPGGGDTDSFPGAGAGGAMA